jgi:hypothetical protein
VKRLAVICWSVSIGIVGLFLGIFAGGSSHSLEKWQVGLIGFTCAAVAGGLTVLTVGRIVSRASRPVLAAITASGIAIAMTGLYAYWHIIS